MPATGVGLGPVTASRREAPPAPDGGLIILALVLVVVIIALAICARKKGSGKSSFTSGGAPFASQPGNSVQVVNNTSEDPSPSEHDNPTGTLDAPPSPWAKLSGDGTVGNVIKPHDVQVSIVAI
jgi:hypothetical protein